MEEIQLKIMPDGDIRIEVRGVVGPRCLELTAEIEQALGIVLDRVETRELRLPVEVKPAVELSDEDRIRAAMSGGSEEETSK